VSQAPVIVVLASTYWRNSWKYRRRAYRHVFWDGGTIVAQLLAQAGADGWAASVVLGFADRAVERLCALDRGREGVVALIPIGGGAPAPAPREPPDLSIEAEPVSPHELSYPEILEAHERGVLDDGRQAAAWRRRGFAPRPDETTLPAVEFPIESAFPGDDLDAVIRRRGSTRAFDRARIARSALEHLLAAASAAVPGDYRQAPEQALVDLYLVVNAVEDVEPGAYRWDASNRRLACLWRGERRRDAGILALGQALGADAAVDVYAVADLDAVLGAMGTRGYRAATLDGGIAGGRIYLAAYADHLGATGLTFFDDDVARFFGLDPRRWGVMFLTAVGVPARGRGG
jgi:nitroreductase